jgi:predicted DCC family thiol-disulfide oxidoreductase YuxK
MAAWKLFYDGGCNLCHASKLRSERWAERAGRPLEVDVLASDEAIAKGYGEMMVLEADGAVLTGADAWLKMMTLAPVPLRWLSLMRLTKPTRAIAAFFYGIVARYRYRWFGTRSCPMPM